MSALNAYLPIIENSDTFKSITSLKDSDSIQALEAISSSSYITWELSNQLKPSFIMYCTFDPKLLVTQPCNTQVFLHYSLLILTQCLLSNSSSLLLLPGKRTNITKNCQIFLLAALYQWNKNIYWMYANKKMQTSLWMQKEGMMNKHQSEVCD